MPSSTPDIKLTPKQERFVDFFIQLDENATQAAAAAGYAIPRQQGSENLAKPVIQQAIAVRKQRIADAGKSRNVTPEWVISKLAERAADENSPASSVSALRTLADILGMTAGNRGELPAALTGMLEALKAGFSAGQLASKPTTPVIELTGKLTDSVEDQS